MAVDQNSEHWLLVAGFWRRVAAFLIDGVILIVPTLIFGLAVFEWAVSLGQSGRLIGFVVALLYFGLLNSRLGSGQTIGKRLLGIRVADRNGQLLSPARSILRFLVFAIPYFLNDLWFDVDAASLGLMGYLITTILAFVVFGGIGAITYLIIFNRRTRQSLHDLVVGSFVVRGAPAVLPIDLTTPRLHLIVVGCWLTLTLVGPGVGIWLMRDAEQAASLNSLVDLQAAIKGQPSVRQVKITTGQTTTATLKTGKSTASFLLVEVLSAEGHQVLDPLVRTIAETVLEHHPDLLGRQFLVVRVICRFDLGIARWNEVYRESLEATAWQEKLARPGVGANKYVADTTFCFE